MDSTEEWKLNNEQVKQLIESESSSTKIKERMKQRKQQEKEFYHKIESIKEDIRKLYRKEEIKQFGNEAMNCNDDVDTEIANENLLKHLKSSLISIAALLEQNLISNETAANTLRNIAGNL
jgi:hypothetical protein